MKSFKQYITEKKNAMVRDDNTDFTLLLSGDIKLDRDNSCKIWEDCGKRGKFRHITSTDGAKFLIKNKNKDLMISAMKFGKRFSGVITSGIVLLEITADQEVWFPLDAYTFVGKDGKRWTSRFNQKFNEIFSRDFVDEYHKSMHSLIKSYPELYKFLQSLSRDGAVGGYGIATLRNYGREAFFDDYISPKMDKFAGENKKLANEFTKKAMEIQKKTLDKYSESIKANLHTLFKASQENPSYYRDEAVQDEAVVSNITVDKVLLRVEGKEIANVIDHIHYKTIMDDIFKKFSKMEDEKRLETVSNMSREEMEDFAWNAKRRKNLPDGTKSDDMYLQYMFGDVSRKPTDIKNMTMDEFVAYALKRTSFGKKLDYIKKTGFKGQFAFFSGFGKDISFKIMKNVLDSSKDKNSKALWKEIKKRYNIVPDKGIFLRIK
jgi:hypothetical protein